MFQVEILACRRYRHCSLVVQYDVDVFLAVNIYSGGVGFGFGGSLLPLSDCYPSSKGIEVFVHKQRLGFATVRVLKSHYKG